MEWCKAAALPEQLGMSDHTLRELAAMHLRAETCKLTLVPDIEV